VDLDFTRDGAGLRVRAHSSTAPLCLALQSAPRDRDCSTAASAANELLIPSPPVELELSHGLPLPGSETSQVKVVGERISGNSAQFDFEGQAGSTFSCAVRLNRSGVRVSGAVLTGNRLQVVFPTEGAWQRVAVSFAW
jgi:hypothetical protein